MGDEVPSLAGCRHLEREMFEPRASVITDRSHPREYVVVQNHLRNTSKPQPMTIPSLLPPAEEGMPQTLLFWGPERSPQSQGERAAPGSEEVTD